MTADARACFDAFDRGFAAGAAGDRHAPIVQMDHASADWYARGRNQGAMIRRVVRKAAAYELRIDPSSLHDLDDGSG